MDILENEESPKKSKNRHEALAEKAKELYSPDTLVSISCKRDSSKKILSQLLPDIVPTEYLEATINRL